MQGEIINIEGVSFTYQGFEALKDVSCSIKAGSYVGIVGPNGSGKSTLIRCLLGLNKPDKGKITLFGVPREFFTDWHKIGYLPQGLQYFNPNFPATVAEVVRLGLLPHKRAPKRFDRADAAAVDNILEVMGIAEIRNKLIGELSGGLRQRTLLARALVNAPELLILDEPTTALDPETRESFYRAIKELNSTRKTTILLVTHDTSTIGLYASLLLYLDKKIVYFGSFEDFCGSVEMTELFGSHSQHLICRRH